MPLVNEEQNLIYLNFYKGNFTRKVSADYKAQEGETVSIRINKNNETVHELCYNLLSEMILADIKEVEHEDWGKQWEFYLLDGNQYLVLRLSKKSRIANQFLNKLENLVLTEPFNIRAYYFEKEDQSGINIFQHDKKLENVYTKEKPGKLPPPKKTVINGEEVWDWSDQMIYWSEVVAGLRPHMIGVDFTSKAAIEQVYEKPKKEDEPKKEVQEDPPMPDEEDDLPF